MEIRVRSQIGRQKYTYTLKQEGDKLTGKAIPKSTTRNANAAV